MKNTMRAITLFLVLALTMAACGSKEDSTEHVNTNSELKVTTSGESTDHKSDRGSSEEPAMEKAGDRPTVTFSESLAESDEAISFRIDPNIASGETYDTIVEDGYLSTYTSPLSTFSIDVDTASYSNIRRFLNDGQLPPSNAVKIEEMVNYFNFNFPQPEEDQPFSITTEIGPCPWNEDSQIAMIGLKGREIEFEERTKTNLVFLLDVSGSMDNPDKLPLLKEAFSLLTEQLGENDRVSIVVYAGASGVVLDGATGEDQSEILDSLYRLDAGGSTAGSQGIQLAYEVAKDHFIYNGNNRVILATDGDFNVGITSQKGLEKYIEDKREEGIFLSVLGFGTGNTNFQTMETLADKGNGHFAYIDSVQEAKKVLVEEMAGTLYTIAKDVKIQVEFNPNLVKSYRLVGYENRRLENEDFNNDQVDAGDIGSGHRVTALYEIKFYGDDDNVDNLRYQDKEVKNIVNEIMFVKLRYKHPQGDKSQLIETPIYTVKLYEDVSDDFIFATAVAEFGLILRQSEFRGNANYDHIYQALIQTGKAVEDAYKLEFLELVVKAKSLSR